MPFYVTNDNFAALLDLPTAMNEYRVVYDATDTAVGNLVYLAIFGFVAVPVWCALLFGRRISFLNLKLKWWEKSGAAVLIGFVFVLLVIKDDTNFKLAYSLRSGNYTVVEGTVADFTPKLKYGQGDVESFRVDGHYYAYTDFRGGRSGFQQTSAVGGPIREGLQVRIHDVAGEIARLEIAD